MCLQEEGIVLIMLSDAAERLSSIPGAKPLPAKSPHRRRGHMLPGSCGYMRPLPPGPGVPHGNASLSQHLHSPHMQQCLVPSYQKLFPTRPLGIV
jgi:hypothetical protein